MGMSAIYCGKFILTDRTDKMNRYTIFDTENECRLEMCKRLNSVFSELFKDAEFNFTFKDNSI